MMKANFLNRFLTTLSIMTALSFSAYAGAGDELEEPLSQLGIERGLELYDRDVADACDPNGLQIRTTINGTLRLSFLRKRIL